MFQFSAIYHFSKLSCNINTLSPVILKRLIVSRQIDYSAKINYMHILILLIKSSQAVSRHKIKIEQKCLKPKPVYFFEIFFFWRSCDFYECRIMAHKMEPKAQKQIEWFWSSIFEKPIISSKRIKMVLQSTKSEKMAHQSGKLIVLISILSVPGSSFHFTLKDVSEPKTCFFFCHKLWVQSWVFQSILIYMSILFYQRGLCPSSGSFRDFNIRFVVN
jgi:hypothetical protein